MNEMSRPELEESSCSQEERGTQLAALLEQLSNRAAKGEFIDIPAFVMGHDTHRIPEPWSLILICMSLTASSRIRSFASGANS